MDLAQYRIPDGHLVPPQKTSRRRHTRSLPRLKGHHPTTAFLKGPVPLDSLRLAAQLPGKAYVVGTLIWYLSGLQRTQTDVPLSLSLLQGFRVSRKAAYRALNALEAGGLISCNRHIGRAARVTIIQLNADASVETSADSPDS